MSRLLRLSFVLLLLAMPACGVVTPGAATSGDAARGEQLFSGALAMNNSAPKCIDCHAVTPDGQPALIGNNLSNIGNRAATTVPGQTAYEYLREAIVDPDKYLSGNFQEGIHYRGYGEDLTPQDVDDLIAYMLTLKSGVD